MDLSSAILHATERGVFGAVATPGAKGVGRLPSRSERGRYRPKNGFLWCPFLRSVAGYVPCFAVVSSRKSWKSRLSTTPKTALGRLCLPEGILSTLRSFCCSLRNCLQQHDFFCHAPDTSAELLSESCCTELIAFGSGQDSVLFASGSANTFSEDPQTRARKSPLDGSSGCVPAANTSLS